MDYTIWLIAAIALIVAEFMFPGFVVIFFGIAALIVATLTWAGIVSSSGAQLALFGILSIIFLVALRRAFKQWFTGKVGDEGDADDETLLGQQVKVVGAFENGRGRVLLNGVHWNAQSARELEDGETARIIGRDSTRLVVE